MHIQNHPRFELDVIEPLKHSSTDFITKKADVGVPRRAAIADAAAHSAVSGDGF